MEQLQLIRKIRKTLDINPQSKSTLVTKADLLRYARLLYEQNLTLRQIIEPQPSVELQETQKKMEEINASLIAYESNLQGEKQKYDTLTNTIKYNQIFLEETEEVIRKHEQRIAILSSKKIKSPEKQALDMSNLKNILEEEGEIVNNEGDRAMLQFMKQFVTFEKSAEDSKDSSIQ